MTNQPAPRKRKSSRSRQPIEVDETAALADDEVIVVGDRHYLHDPNGLLQNARDDDELQQDNLLELDQTELEELGLMLDDPHQPEPE